MAAMWAEVVIDSADPQRLARFWGDALGWMPTGRYEGAIELGPPTGGGPTITIVSDSAPKRGKNRLHLDLRPHGCDQATEVARLEGLGATRTDIGQAADVPWVVLADPEGNEFCVLREPI